MIQVDRNQPIPKPRLGRVSRGTLIPLDDFPFAYMAEGRSFTVSFADRTVVRVRQTFQYRLKQAITDRHIGEGSKFCMRTDHDAKTITFWCVEWVPPVPGSDVMDPPEELRGKGWGMQDDDLVCEVEHG